MRAERSEIENHGASFGRTPRRRQEPRLAAAAGLLCADLGRAAVLQPPSVSFRRQQIELSDALRPSTLQGRYAAPFPSAEEVSFFISPSAS